MNAIQQISLKLRLGLDPASEIQSEQLLKKWQVLNARQCQARARQRLQAQSLANKTERPLRTN